jgi:hypothetical protein
MRVDLRAGAGCGKAHRAEALVAENDRRENEKVVSEMKT